MDRLPCTVPIVVSVALTLAASLAHAETWALQGRLPGPNGPERGTVVITDQKIVAVGKDAPVPVAARVVQVTGMIMPGFIDLHNHFHFNVFSRWRPGRKFHSRYEWMDTADYNRLVSDPEGRLRRSSALSCDALAYAEVKALAGGATSAVANLKEATCTSGLVRNLEINSGFPKQGPSTVCRAVAPKGYPADVVAYEVYPMEITREAGDYYLCELKNGSNLKSLIVHLAEGSPDDSSARREFKMLDAGGFLKPGLVIVHGTALDAGDFAAMAKNSVGLVWSPRSNDELYGATANIPAAKKAGVAIAIGPDWSPTGSAGMLQEIAYAATHYPTYFKPRELLEMATSVPARISRLDDRIGKLQPGYYADITVIGMRDGTADSLATASPAEIQMVVVNGQPVYGDAALVQGLRPDSKIPPDVISVCGVSKAVFLGDTVAGQQGRSWNDITTALQKELTGDSQTLGPIECR